MLELDIVVVEGLEMMTVASFEGSGRDDELCGSKFADDTSLATPSLGYLDLPRTSTIGFPWPCYYKRAVYATTGYVLADSSDFGGVTVQEFGGVTVQEFGGVMDSGQADR
ncbi:hypothetical protein BDZ91DRAFT_763263 [Kalaharituber pfeilii]|nr:hypothetical protein BDZ91DRAFT_763263 [Kalaharituber pfeilii]